MPIESCLLVVDLPVSDGTSIESIPILPKKNAPLVAMTFFADGGNKRGYTYAQLSRSLDGLHN